MALWLATVLSELATAAADSRRDIRRLAAVFLML